MRPLKPHIRSQVKLKAVRLTQVQESPQAKDEHPVTLNRPSQAAPVIAPLAPVLANQAAEVTALIRVHRDVRQNGDSRLGRLHCFGHKYKNKKLTRDQR